MVRSTAVRRRSGTAVVANRVCGSETLEIVPGSASPLHAQSSAGLFVARALQRDALTREDVEFLIECFYAYVRTVCHRHGNKQNDRCLISYDKNETGRIEIKELACLLTDRPPLSPCREHSPHSTG